MGYFDSDTMTYQLVLFNIRVLISTNTQLTYTYMQLLLSVTIIHL